MWSFLLAVGLGTYWCGRYGIEKYKMNEYDRKSKQKEVAADAFYQRYSVSKTEENKIGDMVSHSTPEMDVFREELKEIIGIWPTRPMLIWGFLAKSGKLPERWTLYDRHELLSFHHDNLWRRIEPWDTLTIEEMRHARLKFLIWYDEELRKHGMEYNLMYSPSIGKDSSMNYIYSKYVARPIAECENVFPVAIFWEPVKSYIPPLSGYFG